VGFVAVDVIALSNVPALLAELVAFFEDNPGWK
jgi:hypothetical protein